MGERGRNHKKEETEAEITERTVLYEGVYRPYIPMPSVLYDGSVQAIITCACPVPCMGECTGFTYILVHGVSV
jgi:hypothetical protein